MDASAVPDLESGVRTRLRQLYAAYDRLADAPRVTLLTARGATLFQGLSLERLGLASVPRPGGPGRRALRSLAAPRSLPADLWHSETIPPLGRGRCGELLTLHDLRHLTPEARTRGAGALARALAGRTWLPRIVRRLRGVVTVSEASAGEISRRLRLPPERVHVVANAPAPISGARDEAAAPRPPGPYFLALGHLEARKGLELLLEALALPEGPGAARLVLVGEGPERRGLEALARRRGLEARVEFRGRRSDAEVRELLGGAAALVFPSRLEGYGFPVYEALAAGCPVLASALPCLRALGGPAVVLLEREPRRWARAMSAMLPVAGTLREHARAQARKLGEYTWSDAARALATLYTMLLGAGSSRSDRPVPS